MAAAYERAKIYIFMIVKHFFVFERAINKEFILIFFDLIKYD